MFLIVFSLDFCVKCNIILKIDCNYFIEYINSLLSNFLNRYLLLTQLLIYYYYFFKPDFIVDL